MKQCIRKSMAVFMTAVVLMTTMSLTVDMHYCGELLVDYSFVQQVKNCGMEKAQTTFNCENPKITQKSCCTDTQFIKKGKEDLKVSFDKLTFEQQVFFTSFTYYYISLFKGTESKEVPFIDHPPPFVKRDVQILHQTFLI